MKSDDIKIIDKLKKLLALSERGIDGEAIAARRALESMLQKYGLTIDDIASYVCKERVFPYKDADERTLFCQILISVCGRDCEAFKKATCNTKRKRLYVNLTDLQYIDVFNMYEFHKAHFRKEKKRLLRDCMSAYVNKHDIFDPNAEPTEINDADWDRIIRIMKLADGMEDVSYRKALDK